MLKTYSQYASFFDESCVTSTKARNYNVTFLKMQERNFNDLLRKKGYLFLGDVYEMIGIPITKDSCIVGWIYEEHNEIGDNFVKFIYDENDESACILIDFNVDGNIIDRLY